MPNGTIRRQTVVVNGIENSQVNQTVSEIMNSLEGDAWPIVVGLAEKLFEGDKDVSQD